MNTLILVFLIAASLALELYLARLAMRDAKTKGLNPVLWGAVVFCTTFVGYFLYRMISAPKTPQESEE